MELGFEPREVEADQALGHPCTHHFLHRHSHGHIEGGRVQDVCVHGGHEMMSSCAFLGTTGDSVVGPSPLVGCNEPPQMLGTEWKVLLLGAPSNHSLRSCRAGTKLHSKCPALSSLVEGGKEKMCIAGWSFHSWSKHSQMIYRSGSRKTRQDD